MAHKTAFRLAETHGMLSRPGARIIANSDGQGWSSLFASIQHENPFEGLYPAVEDQLIVLHMDGPVELDRVEGARPVRCTVPAGALHLVPGGEDFGIRLLGELDTMHVYLRRAVIEEVAGEMIEGDPSKLEIPLQIVPSEPVIASLLTAITGALREDDDTAAIFIDYLSRAIASHLIGRHARTGTRLKPVQSPERRLKNMVGRAVEYMSDNLAGTIRLADMARAVNASPSALSRAFRTATGSPPHQYLITLRLKRAAELLAGGTAGVAEIALDCGFANQEHLTRAFRRAYGTTPAVYRAQRRN